MKKNDLQYQDSFQVTVRVAGRQFVCGRSALLISNFFYIGNERHDLERFCYDTQDFDLHFDIYDIDRSRRIRLGNHRGSPAKAEGERIRREVLEMKRNLSVKAEAKRLNRERNGGEIVCEACRLADVEDALFDAHHRYPLAIGQRVTTPADFDVLCPTCHRRAHVLASGPMTPLSVIELQTRESARLARQISN